MTDPIEAAKDLPMPSVTAASLRAAAQFEIVRLVYDYYMLTMPAGAA